MANSLIDNISKLYFYIIVGLVLGIFLSYKKMSDSEITYRDKISKIATTFLIQILTPILIFLTLTTLNMK